ncbi:MAG: DNA gyrase inhibitor YacG [Gammaproteobacteria bacterium]|nr:DNA gyrase inhibitor YacG [Gammaproteobacteria bacterium]MDH3889135.1 DNA gyrase inhibitor YacG [Gammaproteobacteria bacterium]MDH3933915.1 DNA gyrase inhibitor YacG [Gammaproteobacteria bacterium]MDH3972056.1 DNA gyrase inhibitor YacG [Gammaproteobacteria bacterium]
MATGKNQAHSVNCPTCGSPVEWTAAQRWRPFCCERCKLIDLGSWFDESNRIAGDSESPASPEHEE